MKLEIYPEICCDMCNDIVHNHLDCPVCAEKDARTDAYFDLSDEEPGFILRCCACSAKFKLQAKATYLDDWEWEII